MVNRGFCSPFGFNYELDCSCSEETSRTVFSIRWRARRRVVPGPDRPNGVPSYPAPLRPAALPCAAPNRPARGVSGFWIRQVVELADGVCVESSAFELHLDRLFGSTLQSWLEDCPSTSVGLRSGLGVGVLQVRELVEELPGFGIFTVGFLRPHLRTVAPLPSFRAVASFATALLLVIMALSSGMGPPGPPGPSCFRAFAASASRARGSSSPVGVSLPLGTCSWRNACAVVDRRSMRSVSGRSSSTTGGTECTADPEPRGVVTPGRTPRDPRPMAPRGCEPWAARALG